MEQDFLSRLAGATATGISALRPTVLRLVSMGITRKRLLALAVAHGYKRAYVGSLLSEILIRHGRRQRKRGAGPKTPWLALIILAFARAIVGFEAAKFLRAAAHAARREDGAALPSNDSEPEQEITQDAEIRTPSSVLSVCYSSNRDESGSAGGLPPLASLMARMHPLILCKISPDVPALNTQSYPDRG